MSEEWRTIPGHPAYEVSSLGRVRRGDFLYKASKGVLGYPVVSLMVDGKKQTNYVHRLVAAAFIGPCPEGREVAHGNGVRDDNRPENLRYATRQENIQDRERHGTTRKGETSGTAKLTNAIVAEIRRIYRPFSRTLGGRGLAQRFGVTDYQIRSIVRRRAWKHQP